MTPMDLVPLILGVILAACIAGVMAGLLGVGGGIVLVPVLFWMLSLTDFPPELAMHMAVATSMATIVATSASSARAHFKRGSVDFALLKRWTPGLVIGAFAGGLALRAIAPGGLKAVFGIIALLVAVNMATPRTLTLAPALPTNRVVNGFISATVGFVSALMGIGGGTLSVPILTAFSFEIRRAVGTAAAFGVAIAVPAVIGFVLSGWDLPDRPPLSLGYVSLPAALVILPFTVTLAPFGAALAHRLDPKWIKRAFALFLGITAIRMLASVV